MECFRIDESGYTGFDLLNPEQRFQGATAVAIDDDEARRLIREHFPKLQADELKYRALARRPTNCARLMALQRHVLGHHKCVTYVCDKRYLLLLMFLDYAVEPFYYSRGMDFYHDGQNYSLASLLYTSGADTSWGKASLDRLLASFQRAVEGKEPGGARRPGPGRASVALAGIAGSAGTLGAVRRARVPTGDRHTWHQHGCRHGGAAVPGQPDGDHGRRPLSSRARSV